MTFPSLATHLDQLVDRAHATLRAAPASTWDAPLGPGKWTRRELVGHLIDSAINNHQRFVRALSQPELVWPGYAQDAHVRVQNFRRAPAELLLDLWSALNRYLAFLFGQFPTGKLGTLCIIDGAAAMTLEALALDYVAHLEHHLRQLLADTTPPLTFSGMPWPPPSRAAAWPV